MLMLGTKFMNNQFHSILHSIKDVLYNLSESSVKFAWSFLMICMLFVQYEDIWHTIVNLGEKSNILNLTNSNCSNMYFEEGKKKSVYRGSFLFSCKRCIAQLLKKVVYL